MNSRLLIAVSTLLLAMPALSQPIADIHRTELNSVKVEQIADGLDHPWGLAMMPDGRLLVTERSGRMLLVDTKTGSSKALKNVPEVLAEGQGGLLDVVLDPDFNSNSTIYFTFSDQGPFNRSGTALASARFVDRGEPELADVRVIYSMKEKTVSGRHFGSRIVIAGDGNLFVTIGDRGDRERAQDPMDAAGSVLRISKTGEIPPGNPFADGKSGLPEIWSIGHRNAQGAALHPETGELWTLSHGARGGDEINQPEAGKNYGWPVISYGKHYSGTKIGIGTEAPGMEQPIYYWDPSIAPSGLAFYSGKLFPEWEGSLFAGALKFQMLVRLQIENGKVVHEEEMFRGVYGRIRDVRVFDDGAVWLLTDSDDGKILRITPTN